MESSLSRISSAPWFNIVRKQSVLLAGVGGIGSNAAYCLSRLGLKSMFLIDDDIVETENINGQFYSFGDLRKPKVRALKDNIRAFSNQRSMDFKERLTSSRCIELMETRIINTLITGFDNMQSRKEAYNAFKSICETSANKGPFLYIDGRMNAEEFQIICLTSLSEDKYRFKLYEDDYLFADEEAESTICSFKQTSFVAQIIGGMITNLFVNFWNNVSLMEKNDDTVLQRSVPFVTEYSADLMILHSKN